MMLDGTVGVQHCGTIEGRQLRTTALYISVLLAAAYLNVVYPKTYFRA